MPSGNLHEHENERFDRHVARLLRERSRELTMEWLRRLRARLCEHPARIFPDETLLNHMPRVLEAVAEELAGGVSTDDRRFVQQEFRRLAQLRRDQGYGLEELLIELDLLRAVLFEAICDHAREAPRLSQAAEVLEVARKLHAAIAEMGDSTAQLFRAEELEDRRDRAELVAEFGRAITHELRNRLNAARLSLEVLRAVGPGDPEHEEVAGALASALEQIGGVVNDVYAVTVAQDRSEPGAAPRRPLDRLVQEAARSFRDLAAASGVRIRVADELPGFAVDATRVQLVLVNLLTNAIKYHDPGKEERWVEVRAARHDEGEGSWRVEVEDNGVGIPGGQHEVVFEESVRGREGARRASGEGIGLSLARRAVFQLGGRIWVAGEPGRGSTFCFTLREPQTGLAGAGPPGESRPGG